MKPPKPPVPAPQTGQAAPPASRTGLPPGLLTAAPSPRYSKQEYDTALEWLQGKYTDQTIAECLGCGTGAHVRSRVAAILRDALRNNVIRIEVL